MLSLGLSRQTENNCHEYVLLRHGRPIILNSDSYSEENYTLTETGSRILNELCLTRLTFHEEKGVAALLRAINEEFSSTERKLILGDSQRCRFLQSVNPCQHYMEQSHYSKQNHFMLVVLTEPGSHRIALHGFNATRLIKIWWLSEQVSPLPEIAFEIRNKFMELAFANHKNN